MLFLTDRKDLLSFMRTCHALNQAGTRHLLRSIIIRILDWDSGLPKKMDSLTSFILADPDHRGPMVRKLTFAMPDYEECYKESPYMIKLSNAVRYMRNVTTLCMWGVEAWSRLHHGLVDVLADLPCIQDLHLSSQWNDDFELPHRRTEELLGRIASPVQVLTIHVPYDHKYINFFQTLRHFSPTLEYLDASAADLECTDVTFPKLTLAIFQNLPLHTTPITSLLTCLPNLQVLLIPDILTFDHDMRKVNIEAQRRHGTWRSLDHIYAANLGILYSLGLKCRVRYIRVADFFPGDGNALTRWEQILQDMRPSAVHFLIHLGKFDLDQIPRLIIPSIRQDFTHLSLSLGFSAVEGLTWQNIIVSSFMTATF